MGHHRKPCIDEQLSTPLVTVGYDVVESGDACAKDELRTDVARGVCAPELSALDSYAMSRSEGDCVSLRVDSAFAPFRMFAAILIWGNLTITTRADMVICLTPYLGGYAVRHPRGGAVIAYTNDASIS